MTPKDLEGLPTNNLISERDFSNLDRLAKVAKSRNHKFESKGIRNNMTLIKSNTGKIDRLSRRLSQILSTYKNLWEGTRKEKLNRRIIAKIEKSNKTKEHEPESVVANENFKILWDFNIQCDHMIEARRPDIVVVDNVKKEKLIIDVAIPGGISACDKEREKKTRYCGS